MLVSFDIKFIRRDQKQHRNAEPDKLDIKNANMASLVT